MEPRAQNRRIVGVALMAGAGVMGLLAVLIYAGVTPLNDAARPIASGALGAAALIDFVIGLRFLQNSSST